MRRLAIMLVLAAVLGTACGDSTDEDAGPNPEAVLRLTAPKIGTTVRGNVVTLRVAAEGVRIVKADGDTSGATAHYHVFIDRPPVKPGEVIPKGKNIIHTTESPIVVPGLEEGHRQIYVVLGDGTHHRLGRSVVHTSVHVAGPSVRATAPATAKVGEPIAVEVEVDGASLVAANGDTSGRTGHLHVFIDKPPTPAGQMIPKEDGIIHAATPKIDIPAFTTAGEHTLWVVLGDGNHIPFAPPVMDKVTVIVS
jgi:hypothetical protein